MVWFSPYFTIMSWWQFLSFKVPFHVECYLFKAMAYRMVFGRVDVFCGTQDIFLLQEYFWLHDPEVQNSPAEKMSYLQTKFQSATNKHPICHGFHDKLRPWLKSKHSERESSFMCNVSRDILLKLLKCKLTLTQKMPWNVGNHFKNIKYTGNKKKSLNVTRLQEKSLP